MSTNIRYRETVTGTLTEWLTQFVIMIVIVRKTAFLCCFTGCELRSRASLLDWNKMPGGEFSQMAIRNSLFRWNGQYLYTVVTVLSAAPLITVE